MSASEKLLIAAGAGNVSHLERLIIREFADVEVRDDEGRTPLMCAARAGHLKVIHRLLELRPEMSLNSTDILGQTALDHAVQGKHQEIVDYMLADVTLLNFRRGLWPAVQNGDEVLVRRLLEETHDLTECDARGASLLHVAVKRQALPVILELLRHRAEVNALDRYGRTPLDLLPESSEVAFWLQKRGGQKSEDLERWVLLWLKKNFTGGTVPDEVLLEALMADQHVTYKQVLESGLTPFSLKLFNLATTWIRAILPHVLKIDRVSYGLLGKKQLEDADDKTPFSRLVMAVPFVGKDVPSRSSEFAHPDVAIGLTTLAYRYEGLRPSDVRSIVSQLKQDCARQLGPRDTRPAHLLFESWVRKEEPGSPRHKMRRLDEEISQNILPLSLFQPADQKQMGRLYRQIQNTPPVAHFWLRQHVFPVTMNFHPLKISASGHELGSSLLFGYRLGFSGTPSNLLPEDLGECFYEPGSDGQVTAVLTDPSVTTAEVCGADWSPSGLLVRVAADGAFHALIDTGALITNMDNEQAWSPNEGRDEQFFGYLSVDRYC
eukprot:symbB.v1.2.001248.t1/scaffold63.1/size477159/19